MITASITAAPDVETFFREGAEIVARASVRPGARAEAPAGRSDTPANGTEAIEAAPEAAQDADGFTPDTAAKVDWVLAKVAAARAEAKLIRENAELMAREKDRDADALEWRYGPAIQTWLNRELAGSKKKSKRLFHGIVGWRTRAASVTFTNPAAALAHAKEHLPAAVVETLDRKALAERLLETGETVDWASFQPEEETFYIR